MLTFEFTCLMQEIGKGRWFLMTISHRLLRSMKESTRHPSWHSMPLHPRALHSHAHLPSFHHKSTAMRHSVLTLTMTHCTHVSALRRGWSIETGMIYPLKQRSESLVEECQARMVRNSEKLLPEKKLQSQDSTARLRTLNLNLFFSGVYASPSKGRIVSLHSSRVTRIFWKGEAWLSGIFVQVLLFRYSCSGTLIQVQSSLWLSFSIRRVNTEPTQNEWTTGFWAGLLAFAFLCLLSFDIISDII